MLFAGSQATFENHPGRGTSYFSGSVATNVHDLPPSVVVKMPLAPPTAMCFPSFGSIMGPIVPGQASPTFSQVAPLSLLTSRPSVAIHQATPLLTRHTRPTGCRSDTFVHVVPASVERSMPLPAQVRSSILASKIPSAPVLSNSFSLNSIFQLLPASSLR